MSLTVRPSSFARSMALPGHVDDAVHLGVLEAVLALALGEDVGDDDALQRGASVPSTSNVRSASATPRSCASASTCS